MTADLRYPIGRFTYPDRASHADVEHAIGRIERLPGLMRAALAGLTSDQLDAPYRPGGWTVRQVVHHVPDSHMNAYVRTKLALTEDEPVIRPYDQQRWAVLPDTAATPIEASLTLLDVLHQRWALLLRACAPEDFDRSLRHPEIGTLQLGPFLLQYGWHGEHHVAHISGLRAREGW